jgi:hypothetical protein
MTRNQLAWNYFKVLFCYIAGYGLYAGATRLGLPRPVGIGLGALLGLGLLGLVIRGWLRPRRLNTRPD